MATLDQRPPQPGKGAFLLLASVTVSRLAGSSLPTPLYPMYQAAWGFSAGTVTGIFAIYALAVLAALLVAGRLSDHVGGRPVLLVSSAAQVVAMLVMATANGVPALVAGRIIQGLATGAALRQWGPVWWTSTACAAPLAMPWRPSWAPRPAPFSPVWRPTTFRRRRIYPTACLRRCSWRNSPGCGAWPNLCRCASLAHWRRCGPGCTFRLLLSTAVRFQQDSVDVLRIGQGAEAVLSQGGCRLRRQGRTVRCRVDWAGQCLLAAPYPRAPFAPR